MKNQVEILLEDMSFNTKYEFLDMGKNKSELEEVAKKCRLKIPCNDLAIFKGTYAYVDRQNLNGCTLLKGEVEKSLDSLIGKAVDFDHFRKRVVGHWVDSKLEGDTIVAYGVFFKGNFYDDYEDVKKLMEEDTLGISFEAWGTKEMKTANTYNLNDIEFAGGALLMKEKPAFPGAGVLEMAKERVLEFASVMTKPASFIHTEGENKNTEKGAVIEELPELARYYVWDMESIMKALNNAECPHCKGKGMYDVEMVDFKNNNVRTKCACEALSSIDLTPAVKLQKKGRDITKLSTVETVKSTIVEKNWLELFETSADIEDILEESFMNEMEYDESTEIEMLTEEGKKSLQDINKEIKDIEDECSKCDDEEKKKVLMMKIDDMKKKKKTMMDESKKLTYKERQNIKDDLFAVIKEVKNKTTGKPRKIRMFPIADPAHVRNALARLAQTKVQETLRSLGVSIDSVKQKILKRAKELNMKDLLEKYEKSTVEEQSKLFKDTVEELAKMKTDMDTKATELATLKDTVTAKDTEIANLKVELEKVTKDSATATAEIARRDKEIRDAEIAKRKTELGDVAKDMTDEDIMSEDKYTIAKLKKENADLKAAAAKPAEEPKKGSEEKKPETDLDKGSKDKSKETEVFAAQKRVTEKAFGKKE